MENLKKEYAKFVQNIPFIVAENPNKKFAELASEFYGEHPAHIAAITGIDEQMMEAARVDGASRMQIIRHITIPSILPTYFVLLMLNIANFLTNGMEQFFVFENAFNKDYIEVLDLYVYNTAMDGGYSLSTAISILKSVISVVLLFVTNKFSKAVRGEGFI